LSTGEIYPVTETELIDRVLGCSELDAIRTQRELLTRKKLLVGPSSGASLHASRLIAAELPENSNVITILWDAGWKYFAEMRLPKAIESGLATAKFL
jgi:cysteine synthase A